MPCSKHSKETHRRLLSEEEQAVAKRLSSAVSYYTSRADFACSGIIPQSSVNLNAIQLYYRKVNNGKIDGETKILGLPFTSETANIIYEDGQPSPFGKDKTLVYDESYRQAREIKIPNFAFSADPLLEYGIPNLLKDKLNYDSNLLFNINKLNAYGKGGFFKEHKDTPQGKNHIGKLILCLPSPFQGGDLIIKHKGVNVTFDWSNQVKNGDLAWGFLYSDCNHEVLPVEDGTVQELQSNMIEEKGVDGIYDSRLESVKQSLDKLLDGTFLPEGGTLAFGLQYKYPMNEKSMDAEGLEERLKGIDAIFMRCLKDIKLEWDYFGVYDAWDIQSGWGRDSDEEEDDDDEDDQDEESGDDENEDDDDKAKEDEDTDSQLYVGHQGDKQEDHRIVDEEAEPTKAKTIEKRDKEDDENSDNDDTKCDKKTENQDFTFYRDVWTGDDVYAADGGYMESGDPKELSLEKDLDLIWITSPPDDFVVSNNYQTYGNDIRTETIYAAIAIKVILPPAEER